MFFRTRSSLSIQGFGSLDRLARAAILSLSSMVCAATHAGGLDCKGAVVGGTEGQRVFQRITLKGVEIVLERLLARPRAALGQRPSSSKFRPQDVFPDFSPDDLIVGFEEPAHVYAVIGGMRYDGGMPLILVPGEVDTTRPGYSPGALIGRPALRGRVSEESGLISAGVIARLHLPADASQELQASLRASTADLSATCALGACRRLEAGGLVLKDGSTLSSARLLVALSQGGLRTRSGEVVQAEIFSLNSENPAKAVDERLVRQGIASILTGAASTTGFLLAKLLGLL